MGSVLDSSFRKRTVFSHKPKKSSSVSLTRKATATLLQANKPDHWEYGPEIDIEVTLNDLQSTALPGTKDHLCWSGIQVRIAGHDLPSIPDADYHIIAALHPSSYFWFAQAPLRPSFNTIPARRRNAELTQLADGTTTIHQLSFDPFEPDEGWHVARLGDPVRPHWQQDSSAELGEGFFLDRSPNRKSSAERQWVFALCPIHPDQPRLATIQRTLSFKDHVLSGKILIPPRRKAGSSAAPDEKQLDWKELQQMSKTSSAPLNSDLNIEIMLDAAVRQAFAGRLTGSQLSLDTIVSRAFKDHFRNGDQRVWIQDIGRAATRAQLEASYRAFLQDHPNCDRFRVKKRLNIEILNAVQPEPESERCRRLWIEYIRNASPKPA